jgi:predicted DNA-binding protein (UPF0251 family)
MDTRKNTHSLAGPKETSPALTTASADTPSSPPVALPRDLATALRYLEHSDLQRLRAAVEVEIARRKRGTSTGRTDERSAPIAARPTQSRIESTEVAELPEGKANLIRASFDAGLKAPTIARTFGVSLSLVNRIIRSSTKKAIDRPRS